MTKTALGTWAHMALEQGTPHMVKRLNLPTMRPLDPEAMKRIFKIQK